jgi:RNA polymerase sigma factor (sigma-70 family)
MPPHTADVAELISRCKKAHLPSQEQIYKLFYGYAMGICLRYLINRDDALEAVNDSFIKTFKSMATFKEGSDFKSWFRKILVNTALDYKRKNMRFNQAIELTDNSHQTTYASGIEKLSVQDILNLMKNLNELQHMVFNLYEIDGYSHKEISGLLNIPESSSRTYLSRAKQILQQLLITHSIYKR